MTIDVEEHFHVSAFAATLPRSAWPDQQSRVAGNTSRMLDLFAAHGAKATFFVLGCVARAHPALMRRIVAEGHEIGSHGDAHWRVFEQSRAEFHEDVKRAKESIEQAAGAPVKGYRAASFSIDPRSPWAYEVLAQTGHLYSSSSHPIAHDHYGDPKASRAPFREASAGLLEIPVSTYEAAGRRWPCAGGGFFRLFPLLWTRHGLKGFIAQTEAPANFYLHPWEVDPTQPRLNGLPLKSRLRHYAGLARAESKLGRLLGAFSWRRMDEAYEPWLKTS